MFLCIKNMDGRSETQCNLRINELDTSPTQTAGFDASELFSANVLLERAMQLNAAVGKSDQINGQSVATCLPPDVGANEDVVTTSVVYANTVVIDEMCSTESEIVPRTTIDSDDNVNKPTVAETNENEIVPCSSGSAASTIDGVSASGVVTVNEVRFASMSESVIVARTTIDSVENVNEPNVNDANVSENVSSAPSNAALVSRPYLVDRRTRSAGPPGEASTSQIGSRMDTTPIVSVVAYDSLGPKHEGSSYKVAWSDGRPG